MPRKKKEEKSILIELPERDSPDYFDMLVKNCITAYERLNNDTLALDYCKVTDKRLRALILDDESYKRETKSIYARQRLEEVQELEDLADLAAQEEDDDDDEYQHPSERGKKGGKSKTSTAVDRDMLNMRFKAAQMKRDIMKEMASAAADTERDTVNFLYVSITQEEFEKLVTVELNEGDSDAGIEELLGTKEDMPIGTSGSLAISSTAHTKNSLDEGGEDFFDILPNGEMVER